MPDNANPPAPIQALQRIEEAKAVLRELGLPAAQQNERALTLLALLNLKVDTPWTDASNAPLGITPIMELIAQHYVRQNWLVLIEAVTSHGPVTPKRRNELEVVFGSTAGLVFVTAFHLRSDMARYLNEISWETEVWVAEAPTHIIHFNGERFLGPY